MELRLALTGFGNVGRGVAELLRDSGRDFADELGVRLLLTGVADRAGAAVDRSGLDPAAVLRAKSERGSVAALPQGQGGLEGEEFLAATGAQVLIEAASTNFVDAEPGWSYARAALARDMDLVLASKGALVLHYRELMAEAARRGRLVMMAGTVGAPLPIIELYERSLMGAGLYGIEAIVNATCNAILTAMADGLTYEQGVQLAQEAGVAETDPSLDVDGWDGAAKAVILAQILFGADLALHDVQRRGIREVSIDDLRTAQQEGRRIKSIVRVQRAGGKVTASVAPEPRSQDDALGGLDGTQMGAIFLTERLGRVSTTVTETGGVPTALAVLRDVVNLARERGWARLH